MNPFAVLYVVSWVLILVGGVMALAAPVGWLMGDSVDVMHRMLFSAAIPLIIGTFTAYITYKRNRKYGVREGFGIVAFSWLAAGIFGALPFYIVLDFHWIDAVFETISGFTTTGASIISSDLILRSGGLFRGGLEALPYTMHIWRVMTHWLGGMGFVVLSVAILPFLGLGTQNLFRAEITGPTSSQITPRIASAAKLLWAVYVMLTIVLMVILRGLDMDWFNAWAHACSTMATGGYSTHTASVQAFDSTPINMVIAVFMYIASINFILHIKLFRGEFKTFFRDEEWRWYTATIAAVTLILTAVLWVRETPLKLTTGELIPASLANCAEHTFFTVASLVSSTGFATVDFSIWPVFVLLILLGLMMVGGCGGSTSGGLKQSRILLLIKYSIAQIEYCLFPHAKPNLRYNGARLDVAAIYKILGFFVLYLATAVFFTLLVVLICSFSPDAVAKMDFPTAFSILFSSLSNVGPGLGHISPVDAYTWLPQGAKALLALAMIIGRLEFFTLLVLFLPSFWRK